MNKLPAHGGNVYRMARELGLRPEQILDFSASINPLGPPAGWRAAAARALDLAGHYPDPDCAALRNAIAERHDCSPACVVCGNGTAELLDALARIAASSRPDWVFRAVIPVPSYGDYVTAFRKAGAEIQLHRLRAEERFRLDIPRLLGECPEGATVALCRPNNPTGSLSDAGELFAAAEKRPDLLWIVDEAYLDFCTDGRSLALQRPDRVLVLRSLTKFHSIPGLRLGYLVASEEWARRTAEALPPWSVNAVSQAVGEFMLRDREFPGRSRDFIREARDGLARLLTADKRLTVFPSEANFLLVRIDSGGMDAHALAERLLKNHRIAIRVFSEESGLGREFFRVGVRTPEDNGRLAEAVERELSGRPPAAIRPGPGTGTRAIMFQGASSNAGKSVLAAAMGRILRRDGYRVSPFKAQNMTLNAYVLPDGGLMGGAQAVQAMACGREPDARMNPILLLPESDSGSRVVVNGKSVGSMKAAEYFAYRPAAFDAARASYDGLAAESDVMVLEGAGSPGEINLKRHDVVNMRMAEYANARVLIVGDIDRGGLFASFVGLMETFDDWEKNLLAGWVVNRFRGDKTLLEDALSYTRIRTGKPVLGVVPFIKNLGLPEEDSLSDPKALIDAVGDRKMRVTEEPEGGVWDQALDRLADVVRENLDIDAIYRLMGLK